MTVKQAVFSLAPTLERMKKRGFDTQEIVEKLHEKGIEVKPQTLTKHLTESRRLKESKKAKKRDTPPPADAKAGGIAKQLVNDRHPHVSSGGFTFKPDTPLDEL